MSFSFNPPFIQGRVNADSVPGFVREASVLALGFSTLCFQALSFFNYFSGIFPPLEAEAPYINPMEGHPKTASADDGLAFR